MPTTLFTDDFETGDTSKWTGTTVVGAASVVEVVKTNPYGGQYSGHVVGSPASSNNKAQFSKSFTAPASKIVTLICQMYIVSSTNGGGDRFASLDKGTPLFNNLISLQNNAGTWQMSIRKRDGTGTTDTALSGGTPSFSVWHQLILQQDASGTNPVYTCWLDGVQQAQTTDTTTGTISVADQLNIQTFETGFSATAEVYYDNVFLYDYYALNVDRSGELYNWATGVKIS